MIGKRLVHEPVGAPRCVGRIVETEAYTENDPACHAFTRARKSNPNRRGAALYGPPGYAYVYLNYGVYWLLNVVTEREGVAGAVLLRAVEPLEGIDAMRERRPSAAATHLTSGPGRLTLAFGVGAAHNGISLTAPPLYFIDADPAEAVPNVAVSTRIGITKGADSPWRFFEKDNPYVSRGKPSGAAER